METQEKAMIKRFLMINRQIKKAKITTILKNENITQTEFAILHILTRRKKTHGENEMKVSDIAKHLKNANSTVSPVIQSLVEKGYVARSADVHDRRISMIFLTDKGEIYLKTVMDKLNSFFMEIIEQFGVDKTKQLLDLTEELIEITTKTIENKMEDDSE